MKDTLLSNPSLVACWLIINSVLVLALGSCPLNHTLQANAGPRLLTHTCAGIHAASAWRLNLIAFNVQRLSTKRHNFKLWSVAVCNTFNPQLHLYFT